MSCHGAWNRMINAYYFCGLLTRILQDAAAAEIMCHSQNPMVSPKVLTSHDYPAMVTERQCRCMIIPSPEIEEFNIQVLLRRSDRTGSCSRTQMTIVYRNVSDTVCPYTHSWDDFGMMESVAIRPTVNDRPVITLWNANLEFVSVRITFTSDPPAAYNVECNEMDGSVVWRFEDQGLGFDDGIDAGIKVAVVVLFFILAVLTTATVRLILRLKWRKMKLERKKQHARLKQVDQLKQVQAVDNLGFSCTSIDRSFHSHGIGNQSNNISYTEIYHNGKILVFPVRSSTSWSNLLLKDSNQITGQGSVWPYNIEQTGLQQISSGQEHSKFHNLFLHASLNVSQIQHNNHNQLATDNSHVDLQLTNTNKNNANSSSTRTSSESMLSVHTKPQKQAPLHHNRASQAPSEIQRKRLANESADNHTLVENSNPPKDKQNHKTLPDGSTNTGKQPRHKQKVTTDTDKDSRRICQSAPDFQLVPTRSSNTVTNRSNIIHESEI